MIEIIAAIGGIFSSLVLPVFAAGYWALRNMVKNEIGATQQIVKEEVVPNLTNDSTSVASYARQARDAGHETRDLAQKALGVATTVDARLSRLEDKLDAHILGGH